ncbi:MarR family transcriptional regulator [Niveibacterium sp. SC-1]|uniref:MarR family winged helix-turn-helix transcriptional regulator n=1 Tax=Niveibacterium sp. SC-1 TaxID=3135646 RepID=UPI00311DD186
MPSSRSSSRTTTARNANPRRRKPRQRDYERLSDFRYALRCFLDFSQSAARAAGLTPQQHQALLAIKAWRGGQPTVGDLAARLLLRHHSAVELANRLEAGGLLVREADEDDGRIARLRLTEEAEALLAQLSAVHLEELRQLGPELAAMLAALRDEA